jgi:hypothetical protein
MAEPELFRHIRNELKRTVRLLLEQLHRDYPADQLYAIMFEVDVSGTYASRIAGSEESLTRLAEKYVVKGYRVRSGNLLESLRAFLRWDAPGGDMDGWYWGNQDEDVPVTQMIEQAVLAGLIREYDEENVLWCLCLEALRELDSEGVFGKDSARERLLIGATCCEVGFGEEEGVEELATLNPVPTITRLRQELAAAVAVDQLLIRPWDKRGRIAEL